MLRPVVVEKDFVVELRASVRHQFRVPLFDVSDYDHERGEPNEKAGMMKWKSRRARTFVGRRLLHDDQDARFHEKVGFHVQILHVEDLRMLLEYVLHIEHVSFEILFR